MRRQKDTIKCPKCNLVNRSIDGRCRRCGAPVSPGLREKNASPPSPSLKPFTYYWTVPVIAIILSACIYGARHYQKATANEGIARAAAVKEMRKSDPVKQELEQVKRLQRDFMSRLDRNRNDHTGESYKENQALAYQTIIQLKGQRTKYSDPAAFEHFNKFFWLVEKYYDQLVQYNSDTDRLAEVRARVIAERNRVLEDKSLSAEDRKSRLDQLWNQLAGESKFTAVSAGEIDETVQSLRNLFNT